MISFAEAAAHYRAAAASLDERLSDVLVSVTGIAASRARGYIGHQQESWAPLSSATIEGFRLPSGRWIVGKRELGYAGPDYEPLHRSGQLEASIESTVDGMTGVIGSNDKVAVYQEMGTHNARYPIPPRPFLALAVMETTPQFIEELDEIAVSVLTIGA